MFGPFDQTGALVREAQHGDALEAAGVKVVSSLSSTQRNGRPIPISQFPSITAALSGQPDDKVDRLSRRAGARQRSDLHEGGRQEARRDHLNVGFDTSPQIVEGFKAGWVQLTADQQPFMQGYMPILQPLPGGRLRPRAPSTSTPAPVS